MLTLLKIINNISSYKHLLLCSSTIIYIFYFTYIKHTKYIISYLYFILDLNIK